MFQRNYSFDLRSCIEELRILALSARQTKTSTCANSVDPDETALNDTVCHFVFDFRLRPIFASVGKSKFKNGRVHFINSGMKGLIVNCKIKTNLYPRNAFKSYFNIQK